MNKEEGYEANLADISYDCKNFEDRGLQLKFTGYSSTLIKFAQTFIERMISLCKGTSKFDPRLVLLTTEKLYKQYKNANIDVYGRANNNRLISLIPHKFHATLVEAELANMLEDA